MSDLSPIDLANDLRATYNNEELGEIIVSTRARLTTRQLRFVAEISIGEPRTSAYLLAGYSPGSRRNASSSATKLIKAPRIALLLVLQREKLRRQLGLNLEACAALHLRAAYDLSESGDFEAAAVPISHFTALYGITPGNPSETIREQLERILATNSGQSKESNDVIH